MEEANIERNEIVGKYDLVWIFIVWIECIVKFDTAEWVLYCMTAIEYVYSAVFQGRDEGAQIDAWEDPRFEVYHVTDRFGFIQ